MLRISIRYGTAVMFHGVGYPTVGIHPLWIPDHASILLQTHCVRVFPGGQGEFQCNIRVKHTGINIEC